MTMQTVPQIKDETQEKLVVKGARHSIQEPHASLKAARLYAYMYAAALQGLNQKLATSL